MQNKVRHFFQIFVAFSEYLNFKTSNDNLKRSLPLCPISFNIFPTMVAGLIIKTDILLFLTHPGATARSASG